MALSSPGVEVSVIDESFYIPSGPGTLPMIFVVSKSNKTNAAGTGTARGTIDSNAGTPYLITSQRDLADTFGDPLFQIDNNNNPIHGSELNEYGLQTAYSYLGIANRAWVVRADIDLGQLEPTAIVPADDPTDGSYWFDTRNTLYGIQEWNGDSALAQGQVFTNKIPIVITDPTETQSGSLQTNGIDSEVPKNSVGSWGDYAIVATSNLNKLFYRNNDSAWVLVGSPQWTKSFPTVTGTEVNPTIVAPGNITINNTSILLATSDDVNDIVDNINGLQIQGVTAAAVNGRLTLYSDGTGSAAQDSTLGGDILIGGEAARLAELGLTAKTYYPPALQISKHTQVPEFKLRDSFPRPTGSVWLKTTTPNLGAKWNMKRWNDATKLWEGVSVNLYSNNEEALYQLDRTGGGQNLLSTDLYVKYNVAEDVTPVATFKLMKRYDLAPTSVKSAVITSNGLGSNPGTFKMKSTVLNSGSYTDEIIVSVAPAGTIEDSVTLSAAINDAGIENVVSKVDAQNKVVIEHKLGGDIWIEDTSGILTLAGFSDWSDGNGTRNLYFAPGTDIDTTPLQFVASLWEPLKYTASDTEITNLTADQAMWYNSTVDEVDLLVHNGSAFVGFQYAAQGTGENASPSPYYSAVAEEKTDPNGPIVSATLPIVQSDGSALVNGDIWIDTSDLENYPRMYKFNADRSDLSLENRWILIDTGDQTSENGILFADARYGTNGTNSNEAAPIVDLLESDFVDPDSPDPALYPKGMLLWNTRRSGFNVKIYKRNYLTTSEQNLRYNDQSMETYYPHRWVTLSGNQEDGSGSFGRKAQRKVIVQSLQALLNSNEEIRDDGTRLFNIMCCPGYPELIGEMRTLNYDRGLTAFILGDSPMRLAPNGTDLNNWATNANGALEDNDKGLVTSDPYLAVWYPSGYTSDNFGNNVVVPASYMMLRTIALSDQVSYPWFAPAGTRRGGITNASSVGYLTDEGEFKGITLNEGLRDTLYSNNVNPISFVTGSGLINFGQKTRQLATSSLDRINVARLVIYLRQQLNAAARPYLFEANDALTRDEIKNSINTLLLELVTLRAIFDFIVVCDDSNNTPARIDRSELYVDVAIEPVKAIEFIYIPLRLKNTGEIAAL